MPRLGVIRLGVITGLAREADCLTVFPPDERSAVRCVGGDSSRAARTARELVADGCEGLVSFGIAGGLDPALRAGSLVVASAVVCPDGRRIATESVWRNRLTASLGGDVAPVVGDIIGSDHPVLSSVEKQTAYARSGAVAVDMESHAVANVAAELGVSYLVLRAIADTATEDIPEWVPGMVDADGRPRVRAVIANFVRHPFALPVLIRLGRDSEKAFATLRRVAPAAGPLFRFGG